MTHGTQSWFRILSKLRASAVPSGGLTRKPISLRLLNRRVRFNSRRLHSSLLHGLSALDIAQQNWPQLPFIFVSGTLDEEIAIEALKIGATDYVFKTRLARMVPSVQRALREAGEKTELRHAEEALRRSEAYLAEAQKLSRTGSFGWDV